MYLGHQGSTVQTIMISLRVQGLKGYRTDFAYNKFCAASRTHVALLHHCYHLATGCGLPQAFAYFTLTGASWKRIAASPCLLVVLLLVLVCASLCCH